MLFHLILFICYFLSSFNSFKCSQDCETLDNCLTCSNTNGCQWRRGTCHNTENQKEDPLIQKLISCDNDYQTNLQQSELCSNLIGNSIPFTTTIFSNYQTTITFCHWVFEKINDKNTLLLSKNRNKNKNENFLLSITFTNGKFLSYPNFSTLKLAKIKQIDFWYYSENKIDSPFIFTIDYYKTNSNVSAIIISILIGVFLVLVIGAIILKCGKFTNLNGQLNTNERTLKISNNILKDFCFENSFKPVEYNEKNKNKFDICTICLEKFKNGVTIAQLQCEHLFHINCLKIWFDKSADTVKCPNCNLDMNIKKFTKRKTTNSTLILSNTMLRIDSMRASSFNEGVSDRRLNNGAIIYHGNSQ